MGSSNTGDNTRVGVLIPTYNRHDFLRLALDSALKQTHGNLEIVVIDNGSTDATVRYLSHITDERVRYVVNDANLGLIGSINKGIGLFSEGADYCTVLCDDDFLEHTYIAEMLEFHRLHPELIVMYGRIVFKDLHSGAVKNGRMGPEIEDAQRYLAGRAYGNRDSYLSAIFFHRRSFAEIGGYPAFASGWATDDALLFHLGAKGKSIGFNRNALCFIGVHANAESVGSPGGVARSFQAALDFKRYCAAVARSYNLNEKMIAQCTDFRLKNWFAGQLLKIHEELIAANALTGDAPANREFNEALTLVHEHLPARLKTTLFFARTAGISLERYGLYRFMWRSLRDLQKYGLKMRWLFAK